MPRHVLVIVNPASGRARRAAGRLRRVAADLERRGCTVVIRQTRAAGDAERLAREAEPVFDLIVAAGGDGTVSEVANGLDGTSRPMAILPLGTGNVLARAAGLPRAPRRLASLIAEGAPQTIWPGRVGGRLFVAMTGIGFDAEVVAALSQPLKRRIGRLAFAWAILRCLRRYRDCECVVEIDGVGCRVASVVILNGRCYAGGFVLAPAARLDDRLLHVVLFCRAGRVAVLRSLAAMLLGVLHRLPEVSVLAARSVRVAGSPRVSDRPPLVEIDGDLDGPLPIALEIAAAPLLLVAAPPTGRLRGTVARSACLRQ
ncbi:MAG: diacylglycerol/lipid kinase family protein [Stellaceae bacterium]